VFHQACRFRSSRHFPCREEVDEERVLFRLPYLQAWQCLLDTLACRLAAFLLED
jgi:hypothetical protein